MAGHAEGLMLAYLMGFDPKDQRSREEWALNNSADHQEIRQAIQAEGGVNLQDLVLYPINWNDWDAWALKHQSEHDDMNATLGLAGSDLTSVDFSDPRAAASWHLLHFREHQAARAQLAI